MSTPTNFKATAGFDAANQKVVNLADATAPTDALNLRTFDAKVTIPVYSTTRTYPVDFIVEYAGQLWKCVSAVTVGTTFDKTKWTAIRGAENWLRITGAYTATNMDSLLVDTTSAAITITLPASPKSGDYINIIDAGSADINNITINRNGSTIGGSASNSVITEPGLQMTLVYLNATWQPNIRTKNRVGLVNTTATLTAGIQYALQVAASFTVTLPASPKTGDWVVLMDRNGTVGTYPITVAGNSKQIDGAASFTMNQKRSAFMFIYNGTQWVSFMLAGNDLQADKNLSDLESPSAARTSLGLGSMATLNSGTGTGDFRTNSQNDARFQPIDATLTALAGLATSANKLVYATGVDTFALADLTAFARQLLACVDANAVKTLLGLNDVAVPVTKTWPSVRPTLYFDFARSKSFDPRLTFTRSTTATYFDSDGLMKTAAAGVPRIEYDPVTGDMKGLLIEGARQNQLIQSGFATGWTISGTGTMTQNAGIAPDGTNTAVLFDDTDTVLDYCRTEQVINITSSSNTYTVSVFMKAGTAPTTSRLSAYLQAGATTTQTVNGGISWNGGGTPTVSGVGQVTPVGNGWYRVSFQITDIPANANTRLLYRIYPTSGAASQTGSVYIWGGQVELGGSVSSYIPTTTAAVTRNADLAYINLGSWFNASQGTISVEAIGPDMTTQNFGHALVSLNDGSIANMLALRHVSTANDLDLYMMTDSVTTIDTIGFTPTKKVYKSAFSYNSATGYTHCTEGVNKSITSVMAMPTFTRLQIGSSGVGSASVYGHIRAVRYYNRQLTDNEVQTLSY